MCYGDAEGKPRNWRDQNINPKPTDSDRLDYLRFNNSESRRDVGLRIKDFLIQLDNKPDKNIVIVTHGFALTFIIMTWLKVPVENVDYCNFVSGPGRVTLLYEDDLFENRNVVYVNKAVV